MTKENPPRDERDGFELGEHEQVVPNSARAVAQAISDAQEHCVYMFPCGFDKSPRVKHWREQSTCDPVMLRHWEKVDAFIPAIDCGKSNLVVIDVDCHNDTLNGLALWDSLTAQFALPTDTPIVRTPSGGLHIYFSQPDNERFGNSAGEFTGKGIDVRGDGGYVIAPGATLPDGKAWLYVKGSTDVFNCRPPILPDWLAQKIKPQSQEPASQRTAQADKTTTYGAQTLREICEEIATTQPGNQSNKLVHAATRIGSFVAGGEIVEAHALNNLIKAGLMMRNGDPRNPWTRAVVENQVCRALNAGKESPNTAPNRNLPLVDLSNVTVGGKPLDGSVTAETDNYRYRLLDIGAIGRLPPLEWRIKGVFPTQGVCIIFGPSTSGKSFLALDCAASIAANTDWFGYRVKGSFVAYIVLEGEAGFKLRVEALQNTLGQPFPRAFRLVINQSFNLTEQKDVSDLAAAIASAGDSHPAIFIDTFNRAAPGLDENSSKDMGSILQGAKTLQSLTGGLIILIHHVGKDASRGLRGHSSLFAALDGAIEVSRDGEQRTFRIAKSKDGVDGAEHLFRLKGVPLGTDSDDDEITSCVIVPESGGVSGGTAALSLRGANKIAYDALSQCRDVAIYPPQELLSALPTCNGKPIFAPFAVVSEFEWRSRCYARGIATDSQDAKKKAFARARKALLDLKLIHACLDYYWLGEWCDHNFLSEEQRKSA